MIKGESPVFEDKDLYDQNTNILKLMIVRMFINNKITYNEFSKRHREYMYEIGKTSSREITSHRNNLLKAILTKKGKVTYTMFETVIKNILKLNLRNVTMTFVDQEGVSHKISADRMTF